MAKSADAADLKSADRKVVGVQVPLRAPIKSVAHSRLMNAGPELTLLTHAPKHLQRLSATHSCLGNCNAFVLCSRLRQALSWNIIHLDIYSKYRHADQVTE
jgi:hypothetical protein